MKKEQNLVCSSQKGVSVRNSLRISQPGTLVLSVDWLVERRGDELENREKNVCPNSC